MNKLFIAFICFLCLYFSKEDPCSQYSGATCQGHNYNYNSKCYKFKGNSKCSEVEVDDPCEIALVNSNDVCRVKEGTTKTNFECKFIDPPTNHRCKKVTLDAGCKLTSQTSDLKCEKDTTNNQNGENDDCIWEDTTDKRYCKKYTKKCELYNEPTCGGFEGIKNNVQCVHLSTGCKEIQFLANFLCK